MLVGLFRDVWNGPGLDGDACGLQVKQSYPPFELCLWGFGEPICRLFFGGYMDYLHRPLLDLLMLEMDRQLNVLCLCVEFGIAGERLSALVIAIDLER